MRGKRARTYLGDESRAETSQRTQIYPPVEDMDEHAEGTSSSTKRGRGSAKPWKGWGNGEKKIIGWNRKCQPIKPNCHKLASQLGYFARQGSLFPLAMKCWTEVSKEKLEFIWNNVKASTNAPDGFKPICFEKVGTYWRSFKHEVKAKYYKKYRTDQERLAHKPPQLEPEHWSRLVSYWGEEDAQRVAAQNAANRQNVCAHPRTGRTSFAEVIEEMTEENLEIDQISVWRRTRQKKEKYNVEDGAAGREETLTRRLCELPLEEQKNVEVRKRIFEEVIGHDGHGRVLCMGVGVRPIRSGSSSHFYETQITQLRHEADEREIRYQQEMEQRELRHQQELEKAKAEMRMEAIETRKELIRMLQSAGIFVPQDTPNSSSHD